MKTRTAKEMFFDDDGPPERLADVGLDRDDWNAADEFGNLRTEFWEGPGVLNWEFFNAQLTDAFLCGIRWARERAKAAA